MIQQIGSILGTYVIGLIYTAVAVFCTMQLIQTYIVRAKYRDKIGRRMLLITYPFSILFAALAIYSGIAAGFYLLGGW